MKKSNLLIGVVILSTISIYLIYTSIYHFTKEIKIGKFTDITYMHENPLGIHSTMGAHNQELCSKTLARCWKYMHMTRWVAKFKIAHQNGSGFFINTTTGTFLNCLNCKDAGVVELGEFFNLPNLKVYSGYMYGDKYIVVGGYQYENTNDINYALFSIEDKGVYITSFLPTGYENGKSPILITKVSFSPDKSLLAWFACDEICSFVIYNINKNIYNIESTPCQSSKYLKIKWENKTPKIKRIQKAVPLRQKNREEYLNAGCKNTQGEFVYQL